MKANPPSESQPTNPYHVPAVLHFLGGCVERFRGLWLRLGRLESSFLESRLAAVPLTAPLFVCGLARSGSTLLHEVVASHPGVATHRVKDFPMVCTPFWWRQALARQKPTAPRERAHKDRIQITTESPEALEEMLWLAFFPHCHDPARSSVLGEEERHPEFEAFYRNHIRKVLLAEGASRYAAKANYHVARLAYLARLFPDARFLIPVRDPVSHIASLARQHRQFSEGQRAHPRALAYLRRSGHFEFGLDRRPINFGDSERVRKILTAWERGEEVLGWALSWDMVHGYLADLLERDVRVREASLVVRFETMCDSPAETIRAVLRHCALPEGEPVVERFAPTVSRPDYYRSGFSEEEIALIRRETARTAARWGY